MIETSDESDEAFWQEAKKKLMYSRSVQHENVALQERVHALQRQLTELSTAMRQREGQLVQDRDKQVELAGIAHLQMERQKERALDHESSITSRDKAIEELHDSVRKAQEQVQERDKDLANARERLKERDKQINIRDADVSKAQKQSQDREHELAKMLEQLRSQEQGLHEKQEQLQDRDKKIAAIRRGHKMLDELLDNKD